MSIRHLLEPFDTSIALLGEPDGATADHELEVFEHGYQAGWDDCTNAQTKAWTTLEDDFCENLRELSFTYHEAREAVLSALAPFFRAFTEAALPQLTQLALTEAIAKKIKEQASNTDLPPIRLTCHPSQLRFLENALQTGEHPDVTLSQDNTLAEGQVTLRLPNEEVEFDPAAFQTALSGLIDAHFKSQT